MIVLKKVEGATAMRGHVTQNANLSEKARPQRRALHDKRNKSFVVAHYVRGTFRYRCHILNISSAGALVAGSFKPLEGETCDLEFGGALHKAAVVWCDDIRFGVIFVAKLDDRQVSACL